MPETDETPAAVLRRAADKLRKLATADDITPGPWLCLDGGDRIIHDGPSIEFGPADYVVDEPVSNSANAELIAAMHPGVGVALADWLEYEARLTDQFVGMGGTDRFDSLFTERPLAVALAVLGEDAPAATTDVDAQQVSR